MMRRMQHASPENPDSLPLHIKERMSLHPPLVALTGQKRKAGTRQLLQPHCECLRTEFQRKHFARLRLGAPQELLEKAPLRENLMPEYLFSRAGFRVRAEREIRDRKLAENRSGFVDLAGVRLDRVLQEWILRPRQLRIGDH